MSKQLTQGLVQIYTGTGKGKTTAALGLGLRAIGHGFKVEMIQYMKGSSFTGELYAVERLPNFSIKQFGKGCTYASLIKEGQMKCTGCGDCFYQEEDRREHQNFVDLAYEYTKEVLEAGEKNIIILDEISNALHYELLSINQVLELIQLKSEKVELILTGRGLADEILAEADLVTEMKAIKHPFQEAGVKSRRGIEY